MSQRSPLVVVLSFVLVTAVSPSEGVTLYPGDILVTHFPAGVIRVDPATGAQSVITSGGRLLVPAGIAITPSGDPSWGRTGPFGAGGPQGVVKVDPRPAPKPWCLEFGVFDSLRSVVIDDAGALLVTQGDSPG